LEFLILATGNWQLATGNWQLARFRESELIQNINKELATDFLNSLTARG